MTDDTADAVRRARAKALGEDGPEAPASDGAGESAASGGDSGGDDAAPGADDGGEEEPLIKRMLLSTEPDLKPADVKEQMGVGLAQAHFVIGLRKMLAVLLPAALDIDGTPAVQNIATAVWLRYVGEDDGGADSGGGSAGGGATRESRAEADREGEADREAEADTATVSVADPAAADAALAAGHKVTVADE